MARRCSLALPALASALLLTACGGGENAADATRTQTALPPPETSASAPVSPASPPRSGSPTATPPSSPPSPASPRGDAPTPAAPSWSSARKSHKATGAGARPLLEAVRVGRHETFDRVVFEFSEGTPEFYAQYTQGLRQGGSGRSVEVAGDHVLLLVFRGQTPESHLEVTGTTAVIREVVTASVFEGDMRIGIGLAAPGGNRPGFRVDTLGDRVVLDFARTA